MAVWGVSKTLWTPCGVFGTRLCVLGMLFTILARGLLNLPQPALPAWSDGKPAEVDARARSARLCPAGFSAERGPPDGWLDPRCRATVGSSGAFSAVFRAGGSVLVKVEGIVGGLEWCLGCAGARASTSYVGGFRVVCHVVRVRGAIRGPRGAGHTRSVFCVPRWFCRTSAAQVRFHEGERSRARARSARARATALVTGDRGKEAPG